MCDASDCDCGYVCVPEMDAGLPGGDGEMAAASDTADAATVAAFERAWAATVVPKLARCVTPARLAHISRWAQAETAALAGLPDGWAAQVPMRPLLSDDGAVVFGQRTSEGLPLPSHHRTVFRRLVLRAVFHNGTIEAVFVSIRGWREE